VEIRLERLSPETLHDFLDYFDHRAFLNDEDWAGCYCQAYLNPPETNQEEIFGEGKARQAACDRVAAGRMDGYLAFDGDKMVGWCAAGNSKLYEALPDAEDTLARIICFNVDPDLRHQGIASQMLDLVIQDLIDRGFAAIEAVPSNDETSEKSFQGTVSMFTNRGFEKVVELPTGQTLMRRHLD
jgi:ribosomal protein S18 acetylase RimI-like enzyme